MFKKLIVILLSIFMIAVLAAGCGSAKSTDKSQESTAAKAETTAKEEPKEEAKTPATISIWYMQPDDTQEDSFSGYVRKFVDNYQKANPHITIKVTPNVANDKILTALSSGDGPDIFMNYWPNCATWSDKGALLDLTEFANNDKDFDKDDFIKGAMERGIYKGKLYGIPNYVYSSEIYYNKDLLAKDGFTAPPETIEQLVEMALKLTKYDSKGNIIQAGFIPDFPWLDNVLWPVAFGAKWIDPATNKLTFDSPEMAAAYQWQVDLYNKIGPAKLLKFKSGLGKLEGAQDPFITGKVAMQFSGEWTFGTIAQYAPNLNYGIAPIPYPQNNPAVKGSMFVTTSVWCANANTKNDKNEVWKVLAGLTSKDTYKMFAQGKKGAGDMMARKTALNALPDTANPNLKEVAKLLQNPNCDGFPMLAYVNEYLTAINDEMSLALTGKQSVAQAQKKVMDKIQPLANKYPINK